MLRSCKTRLVIDPGLTSMHLQQVLSCYMQAHGTRDLRSLLIGIEQEITWKCAPRLQFLIAYHDLYMALFARARNTVVSHAQLVRSMLALHQEMPCLFTSRVLQVEAGLLSTAIRAGCAKWRALKADRGCYLRISGKVVHLYIVAQVVRNSSCSCTCVYNDMVCVL